MEIVPVMITLIGRAAREANRLVCVLASRVLTMCDWKQIWVSGDGANEWCLMSMWPRPDERVGGQGRQATSQQATQA
ncbi:hypothetical protein FPJ27_14570 [Burkholderia sp. MS455]|uniref:hypothetical protein n=1 Tax=Burkholderia sp. MS455 TaxID=2811788 RepID=UPI00195CB304|nr:hypothetical protein [Burkholderia sp. MS455]QRR07531.1 hypothetical protein FPJ27_14570 [Burkholderia sp. MS455]